jgi:hypothetical protein
MATTLRPSECARDLFFAAALAFGLAPLPAAAEDAAISLELNRLETVDGRCSITLVSTNALGTDLERLVVELVLFDAQRRALRFMRVALPALAAGRSRALMFDAEDLDCTGIASILFNGAVECTAQGLDAQTCAAAIAPSSRAPVPFVTGFAATAPSATD